VTAAFVNPLQRRPTGLADHARQIKQWVRSALSLPDGAAVSVNELACHIPGCPPKETVILVMDATAIRQASLHKPLSDITAEDIRLATWTGGIPSPENPG
jgi:hypothetical protein